MAGKKKAGQGGAQASPQIEGSEVTTDDAATSDGLLGADPDFVADDVEPEGEPEPEIDTREIDPENGLPIGGVPIHGPHPETPALTEIIPGADFNISIRGVLLQFRDGKRAHVDADVLRIIKSEGVPYKTAE